MQDFVHQQYGLFLVQPGDVTCHQIIIQNYYGWYGVANSWGSHWNLPGLAQNLSITPSDFEVMYTWYTHMTHCGCPFYWISPEVFGIQTYNSDMDRYGKLWKVVLITTANGRNPANHLGWLKPYKEWDNHHPWWCRILSINSMVYSLSNQGMWPAIRS